MRGFAVVHCLGILTSMFSAVVFSRGLVNLWYGRKGSVSVACSIDSIATSSSRLKPSASDENSPNSM